MTDKEIEDFVMAFMTKHTKLVSKIAYRYLIPNRYSVYDIKQYISERILKILKSRATGTNPVKDPEKYFKSCLEFYCVEFQRMHGFVFGLPKRPRKNCEEDELNIRGYGFKYLNDLTSDEVNSLQIVETVCEGDIHSMSSTWNFLTGLVNDQEAAVLDCIFSKNMTWHETAEYLNVPQSTCWFRNHRAINKISKYIDILSGDKVDNIKKILRNGSA